ncbi:MAG: hypothetical protein Q4E28_01450 [Clostridia bacterium]|nr:hypothetical protein [Clostridia bacterium]
MKTVKKSRLFTVVMAVIFTVSTIFAVAMTAFAANQNKIVTKGPVGTPAVRYCDVDFVTANAKTVHLNQFVWLHLNSTIQWSDAEYQLIFDKELAPHITSITSSTSAEGHHDQHVFEKKDDRTWAIKVSPYATEEDERVAKDKKGFFFTGLIGVKQEVEIKIDLDKPYQEFADKDYAVKAQVVNTKEKTVFKEEYKEGAVFSETESATYIPFSQPTKITPEYNNAEWLKASGMKVTYFPNGIDDEYIENLKKITGNHILEADYKTTVPTLLMDGQFVPKVGVIAGIDKKDRPLDMVISIPKDLAPYISKVTLFGDRGALKDSKHDITKEIKEDGQYVLEKFVGPIWKDFENVAGAPTEYRIQIELNQDISGLPIFNKNFLETDVQMTSRNGQTIVPFGYQNAIIEFGYFDEDEEIVVPPADVDDEEEEIKDDETPKAPAPKEEIKDDITPLAEAPKTSLVGTSIIISAITALSSGTAMVASLKKKND